MSVGLRQILREDEYLFEFAEPRLACTERTRTWGTRLSEVEENGGKAKLKSF
jgi:hypothetical protein